MNVFRKWLNRYRLNQIVSRPCFETSLPYFHEGRHFDIDNIDGKIVVWSADTLKPVDIDKIIIPPLGQISWIKRNTAHTTKAHNRIKDTSKYLELRGAGDEVGIQVDVYGKTYYITKNSYQSDSIKLIGQLHNLEFPRLLLLGATIDDSKGTSYNYAAKLFNVNTGLEATMRPIVDLAIGNEQNPGIVVLTEVENMPGLFDAKNMDVIFRINELDTSSTPIVDLTPFVEAVLHGFDHGSQRTFYIDNFFVKVGMLPNPIRIRELATELPNHRFFLRSGVRVDLSRDDIIYKSDLPTQI